MILLEFILNLPSLISKGLTSLYDFLKFLILEFPLYFTDIISTLPNQLQGFIIVPILLLGFIVGLKLYQLAKPI